jgi:hypothetical protein
MFNKIHPHFLWQPRHEMGERERVTVDRKIHSTQPRHTRAAVSVLSSSACRSQALLYYTVVLQWQCPSAKLYLRENSKRLSQLLLFLARILIHQQNSKRLYN